jgi:hypothetical protein
VLVIGVAKLGEAETIKEMRMNKIIDFFIEKPPFFDLSVKDNREPILFQKMLKG